jgi:WD40 repeat protein
VSGDVPVPGELAPGTVIAGYRVEAPIGAGGMAAVYRARDERLPRAAALKVIAPQWAGDPVFRKRFIAESRAAAKVDHPNVIPVYKAGEDGDVLFLAMRLVAGGDLTGVLHREGPRGLAPGRALELLEPVASALDAAHAAGLVHRDVKPANILIDTGPGVPGGAEHVYLSDFGITKDVQADADLTRTGQFLGTPFYAAPEQARGERGIDGRADQYALGCVAFQLLTGRPPFERDSDVAVLAAHLTDPPPALSRRRPDLPAAAGSVLARVLAKAPADRYPSCRDFTGALAAALAGTAGGPRSWAGRHRGVLISGAASAAMAAGAAALIVTLVVQGPNGTVGENTAGTGAAGPASTFPATPAPAVPAASAAPSPGPGVASNPSSASSFGQVGDQLGSLVATLANPGPVTLDSGTIQLAVAPDGTTLAAGDANGTVYLWNLSTRKRVASLPDPEPTLRALIPVTFSPIPLPSISLGPSGLVVVPPPTASATGNPNPYAPTGGIGQLAFAPGTDGGVLAAGDMDGSVYLWDTRAQAITGTLSPPGQVRSGSTYKLREVNAMAFSPGGSTLAVADIDGSVDLWSTASRAVFGTLPDRKGAFVESLAFAPDGTTLATGNGDGTITLWDIVTGKVIATLNDRDADEGVNALAFSPDGRILVAGDEDGSAYLWNVPARKLAGTLADPRGNEGVTAVAFAPDGKAVAVGNANGSVSVWLIASRTQAAGFFGPGAQGVSSLAFTPGGTLLADGDADGSVYLWRITAQEAK